MNHRNIFREKHKITELLNPHQRNLSKHCGLKNLKKIIKEVCKAKVYSLYSNRVRPNRASCPGPGTSWTGLAMSVLTTYSRQLCHIFKLDTPSILLRLSSQISSDLGVVVNFGRDRCLAKQLRPVQTPLQELLQQSQEQKRYC